MGISPIDLQTLYTQMDKVGKSQLSQQAALQQARDAAENDVRKAAEAKAKSVQKTEAGESEVGKVSDRKESDRNGAFSKQKGKPEEKDEAASDGQDEGESSSSPLDAGLGCNVDISV